MQQQRFDAMTNDCQVAGEAEMRGQPPMLPSAASTRPTHITSRLPPIPSLQHKGRTNRTRSPSRGYKEGDWRAKPNLPSSNTLQTFLTVTEADHDGQDNHEHPHHHHGHDKADMHHSSEPGHGWRVRKTPIFSGIVAPFSIMLEVPGLTSKWYAKIDADGIVERFIENPTIITVGLAISLGAAVVANFAIVARFLELLRPRVSIALAIAGFVLHDVINVIALATFGGIYGPKKDGLSLSAAYWMVCASTITSTLVTISLIMDYVRTNDFRHAGSGLTQLQKGLVLAVMGLLLYLSLGSLVFVFVIGIDFITALYFSTATVLTVGFGDVVPASPGGKILVIIYAPVGIVLVALVVSAARSAILETFQAALLARNKERRRRLAQRKEARRQHKRQDRAIRRIMPRTFTFGPGTSDASGAAGDDGNDFAEALARMEKQAATPDVEHDTTTERAKTASSDSATAASDDAMRQARGSEKSAAATAGDPTLQREISALQHELLVAKQRTEQDFRQFEEHLRHEAIVAARTKLVLAASVTWAFWLLGAVAFTYAERWSYGGAMWFCFIAMITIGYGDYHPSTQLGRAIFVIWGLMGVAVLTILLAVVQDAFGSIFHRVLTKSTSRLFNRAEARAHKRRLRKQRESAAHLRSEVTEDEEDVEGRAVAVRAKTRPWRHPQRKSEGDAPRSKSKPAQKKRRSMEACVDRPALVLDRQTSSPEALEPIILDAVESLDMPSYMLEPSSGADVITFASGEVTLPAGSAARMEDTLVSTPQKLALAALQTFQHSVRVMQLNESTISQAMTDVPALRNYYNSRQRTVSVSSGSSAKPTPPAAPDDAEQALQKLHASIQQTANPEYEKVAKLVVANLEFEHHLRLLLDQFQGLKIESKDSSRPSWSAHAPSAPTVKLAPRRLSSYCIILFSPLYQRTGRGRGQLEDADLSAGKRDWTMATRCGQIWLEVSPRRLTKRSWELVVDASGLVWVRQSMSMTEPDFGGSARAWARSGRGKT